MFDRIGLLRGTPTSCCVFICMAAGASAPIGKEVRCYDHFALRLGPTTGAGLLISLSCLLTMRRRLLVKLLLFRV